MLTTTKNCVFALALLVAPLGASARAQAPSLALGVHGGRAVVSLSVGRGLRTIAPSRSHWTPRRVWIEGRYEARTERVRVPGCTRREWVPPCYEWRVDVCGRRFQVLVRGGTWRTIHEPGHYEFRAVRAWVPGHWETRRY